MMDPNSIQNGLIAVSAGLLISPHCVAMCGPLSCAMIRGRPGSAAADWNRSLYHLGRVLSYTLLGALAGAMGLSLVKAFGLKPVVYFPWFLVAILLLFALRLDRHLPRVPFLRKGLNFIAPRLRRIPGPLAGLGLGLATPSLPCAPLYSIFWVALLSGSPWFGAEIAMGFALGTIPLLWSGQQLFSRLQSRLTPGILLGVQRSIALLAASIIVWRIVVAGDAPLGTDFCGLQ